MRAEILRAILAEGLRRHVTHVYVQQDNAKYYVQIRYRRGTSSHALECTANKVAVANASTRAMNIRNLCATLRRQLEGTV